jgi:hypothetical protein
VFVSRGYIDSFWIVDRLPASAIIFLKRRMFFVPQPITEVASASEIDEFSWILAVAAVARSIDESGFRVVGSSDDDWRTECLPWQKPSGVRRAFPFRKQGSNRLVACSRKDAKLALPTAVALRAGICQFNLPRLQPASICQFVVAVIRFDRRTSQICDRLTRRAAQVQTRGCDC